MKKSIYLALLAGLCLSCSSEGFEEEIAPAKTEATSTRTATEEEMLAEEFEKASQLEIPMPEGMEEVAEETFNYRIRNGKWSLKAQYEIRADGTFYYDNVESPWDLPIGDIPEVILNWNAETESMELSYDILWGLETGSFGVEYRYDATTQRLTFADLNGNMEEKGIIPASTIVWKMNPDTLKLVGPLQWDSNSYEDTPPFATVHKFVRAKK